MADLTSTPAPGVTEVVSCVSTNDCRGIINAFCDLAVNACVCDPALPVLVPSIQECVNSAALNSSCRFDSQCSHIEKFSSCDAAQKRCVCIDGYKMKEFPDVGVNCVTTTPSTGDVAMDPAMYGILGALILMFVIICIVLRLFSKARFRENRSIFNTPNPRLMNASLFKESKLLSPSRGERRGSRAPHSRTPSLTSVNRDYAGRSHNGSLIKGRRGSTLSTASATGSAVGRSARTPSPTHREKTPEETSIPITAMHHDQ